MPCLGLSPFLLYGVFRELMDAMCQCPVSGYPHFYMAACQVVYCSYICVNALSRAIPISTASTKTIFIHRSYGVNALSRAIPISTKAPHKWPNLVVCQCPVSGYPHFYSEEALKKLVESGVSMPCLGLSPFLRSTAFSESY